MYKLFSLFVLPLCCHQVADLGAHLVVQQVETHQLVLRGRQKLFNQGITLKKQVVLIGVVVKLLLFYLVNRRKFLGIFRTIIRDVRHLKKCMRHQK